MMHVVLGDGEMSLRELSKTLEDLLEKAADQDFWFLVQGKAEPTATDKAMMKWIADRAIYYEVVTSDKKGMDAIYKTAAETHEVKNLAPKVVGLMQEKPGEGESAALYALYDNNAEDVPEDEWLGLVGTAVAEADFKVFALNEGLVELGFGEEDEAAEEEEEAEEESNVVELPPRKKAAPRAPAASDPADDEDEPEEEPDDEDVEYTREALEAMNIDELKAIAAKLGIEVASRSRMPTYIKAILGDEEDDTPVAEVEDVVVASNGNSPAMLIVIVGGNVLSKAVTEEEALSLIGSA
jgi:hypothetical protein